MSASAAQQAPPPVQTFLRYMQGASHLERHEVDGGTIRLWFRPDETYFSGEEFVARMAIGAGFVLLYRFGFAAVEAVLRMKDQNVRVALPREEFGAFFGLGAQALANLAKDPDGWDASPLAGVTPAKQWEFFLKFAKYEK
jgi:hypothetical protein